MLLESLTADLPGEPAFRRFRMTTGSSKERVIDDPNPAMREVHKRLREFLEEQGVSMPCATAVRGSSVVKHLEIHMKSRYLVHYDLHNAYQNVNGDRLAATIWWQDDAQLSLGDEAALAFLREHCLLPHGHGLRTGGPASPDLFNRYAAGYIDFQMAVLCRRMDLIYSRYMDDILISSNRPIGKQKRAAIREIIRQAGFSISRTKARVIDLRRGPVELNGLGLEWGRIFVPRRYFRRVKGLMHQAMAGKPVDRSVIDGYMGLIFASSAHDTNWSSAIRDLSMVFAKYREWLSQTNTEALGT